MRFTKRVLSALLALVMVFTMLPLQVWAEEVGSQDSDNSVNLVGMYGGAKAADPVAARVELNESSALISIGNTYTFSPTVYDEESNPMEVTGYIWTSDNPEIASVENGTVTGVNAGVAKITCQYGELTAMAMVTVTQATYQLTYSIEYPSDAKKFAYNSGVGDDQESAVIVTPLNTTITESYAPGTEVTIPDGLATTINYRLIGFADTQGDMHEIGSNVAINSNMTLTSIWDRVVDESNEDKMSTITLCYHSTNPYGAYGGFTDKSVSVMASEPKTDGNRQTRTITFMTANIQDTLGEIDKGVKHRNLRGWSINGEEFGFNSQATVTIERSLRGEWPTRLNVYPVEGDYSQGQSVAQFYVRKQTVTGTGETEKTNYYSVGTGTVRDLPYGATPITGEDVQDYIVSAPSLTQIASLMNESLPAGATVNWYKMVDTDNGYHVDGEIRISGRYWNVKFIDPDSGKAVEQQLVQDGDILESVMDGSDLNTRLREFKHWSLRKDGEPVNLTEHTVHKDITFYAVFKRYSGYTVKHLFEDLDGNYVEDKERRETIRAEVGEQTNATAKSVEGFTAREFVQKKVAADGRTTIEIEYSRNSYDVRYTITGDAQGVTAPEEKTYKFGATVEQEAKLQKEGYSFDGWNTDDVTIEDNKFKMPAKDVTFTGEFIQPYTVTVKLYAGSRGSATEAKLLDTQVAEVDWEYLLELKTMSKEALATRFWGKEVGSSEMYGAESWSPKDLNKTIHNYTVEIYLKENSPALVTLTYDANAGTDEVTDMPNPLSAMYLKGKEVTVSDAQPTRENYTFTGWNTAADGSGTRYSAKDPITLTDDTILYAQWTANTADYKVQYWFQKADGTDYEQHVDVVGYTARGNIGDVIIPTMLAETEIPAGFEYEKHDADVKISAGGSAVAKVYYDRKIYNISYELEGDVEPEGANVPNSSTGRYGAVIPIAGDLLVDGYTFTGWYTKEGANVEVGENDPNFTMPAGDVTLYGKFSKRTDLAYTVNYIWNGENLYTATGKGTLGDPIDPEVKDFEGYTFKDKQTGVTITADAAKNVVNVYYYKNVTLTAKNAERTYNGVSQSLSGYTASVEDLIFNGVEEPTASGINAGKYDLTFADGTKGKTDSTDMYIVTEVVNGTLTINKLPVTVTAQDINVAYGKPVENLTATKSAAAGVEIPDDFDSVVTYELAHDGGETPNVGEYPIYFKIGEREIKETVTDKDTYQNYEVTFNLGTLTVTAAEGLTFQAEGYNDVYDGRDHSATATSDISGTTFKYMVDGDDWQDEAPSIKDVGSKFVMVKAINSNYVEVDPQRVELKVTPRPVTLTSQGASKMYDGTPLSKEEVVSTTTLEGKQPWVEGEGVVFSNFAQQTDVTDEHGVDNIFVYQPQSGTNLDNYEISEVYGKLIVTPSNALTVVATDQNWTYDGIERSPSVQVKIGDQEIQDAEVLYSKDGQAWSETPIKVKNVSDSGTFWVKAQYSNYQDAEATYKMTVSKRAVTIRSADGKQVYNGTPLKVEKVNVVAGSFVQGEGLNYTDFTEQTNVTNPPVDNKYSYSCAEGTLKGNYNIKQEFGQLTVTPAMATVSVKSITSHVYDGLVPEVTATVEGVLEQDREKIQYELTWKKLADVGTYDVIFQDPKTTQGNYEVTFVNGTVTIDPKPVTVTAVSPASVEYGNELPKLTIEVADLQEQLVNSDDISAITYTLAYDKTNFKDNKPLVGEHTIKFVDPLEEQGNYKVSFVPAKLTVTAPDNLNGYVAKTHAEQNFKVGDTVTFKISVTNIYAVNATVTLKEEAGMTFENGQTTLEDVLDPGQTKTYTATRTLTDADFKNDGVSNTVEVTLDPEGEEPEIPGTGTDEVELEEMPNMSVVKTVLNPKESYRVGDTIQYQITVTNTGNVTLHDLELTDVMNADGKVTFPAGTDLTRKTLNVGDSWIVTCSYVVRAADEGKTISNTAKVISRDDDGNPNKDGEDTTPGESVQKRYSLTIHYRNGAGNAVAGSYSARYHVGDSFKIVSPIVAGYYDPQTRSISSGANGMPAQDLEYVVIYTAIPVPAPDPGPGPAPNPGPGPGPAPNPGPDDGDDDDDTPPVPDPEQELPPQPQDFEIDPDDYTLTELEDNETPLANLDLDGHTCCILHLLLMLAAMVVLGFYTKSRKKHQARIFELKRILAAEEDHPDDPQQP